MRKIFSTKEEIVKFWNHMANRDNERRKIQKYYTTKKTYLEILKSSNLFKTSLILDAGCGWGRITRQFLEEGYSNIIGIDLTFNLLQSFKKDGYCVKLINADTSKLPFASNTFDLVYAVRVLQYIDNIYELLYEFKRIIKPGGNLTIIQPNSKNPYRKIFYHTKLIPAIHLIKIYKSIKLENISIHYFGFNFPNYPIPWLEYLEKVPLFKKIGAFYLIRGTIPL